MSASDTTKKRILFITHQLSYTGAPMVLMDVIHFLKEDGYDIHIFSMGEGPLRGDIENMGIPLDVYESTMDSWRAVLAAASGYDAVFANTLLTFGVPVILNNTNVPVYWWIHEPVEYFDEYRDLLPDFSTLGGNVHILAVSPLVADIILERYGVSVPIFPFGVRDVSTHKRQIPKRVRFYTIAHFSYSKGQDVLAAAIASIDRDVLEKSEFHFFGDLENCDENYLEPLKQLQKYGFPVMIHNAVSHKEILDELANASVLIVPSRIEAMPTVAAEAMMQSVPVLISDACGISKYMEEYDTLKDWVFPSEDIEALRGKIEDIVAIYGTEQYFSFAKTFRDIYDNHFSLSRQKESFYELLEENSLRPAKGRLICVTGGNDICDLFMYDCISSFCRLGYEVFEFSRKNPRESITGMLEFVRRGSVKAAITFNFYSTLMELTPGRVFWDQFQIPMITILMDHPFCFEDTFEKLSLNHIILCPDKNHMNYILRFFPNVATVGFLGHGGTQRYIDTKAITDRGISVFYAGGISISQIDKVMPDFSKYGFNAKEIGESAYQYLIAHPDQTTEDALEMMLSFYGISLSEDELWRFMSDMHYVDLMAVSYFRERTLRTVAESGIDITLCGYGWEMFDWVGALPNVDYRGRVSSFDIIDYMADAKIVLSTMTWFKDGTHDRIFNGMLQGAFSITDISKYMEDEFEGIYAGEEERITNESIWKNENLPEVGFFRLKEIDKLPNMISTLLENPDILQTLADNGRKKANQHSWYARAMEMDRELLKFI